MAEVKSLSAIQEKYGRVTPGRSEDYKLGVASPRRDWQKAAIAGEANYKTGVTAAANAGLYGKGVNAAGTQKWKDRALAKGPGRFSEGTMLAAPDFAKGFAKFRDVIEKTTLPARFPKGDPRNVERVRVISSELRKAKVGS
ncbi:MAG: hypothetical protein FJ110_05515 [Deltaproteobacteria bacterium]|nr:hypothetical protein [Deltaproteobacteria bacterium]